MKRCLLTALIITCAFFQLVRAQKSNIEQLTNDVIQSLTENNLIQARTGLKKLLTTAPQNPTVQTLAGIIADRENNLVEAEKHFSLAAKLAPKSAETRNNYGAILVRMNRQKHADKEFTASLTINPDQPSALVNLGQISFSEGNLTTAREMFNKAAKIQPDTEILRSLVLISLQLNDKAQATTEFPKFSALLKNSPATTFESEIALGKALSKNGLFAEAKELFEIILAKNPDQIEVLVQL
ncbi:MAG TPA: tetratricopeptide repeat protein, partial [Pyrinomonadaceae bacterium]|nr:tetratricopeptide repeat protein [Pyrinomonadaceae bacterium]